MGWTLQNQPTPRDARLAKDSRATAHEQLIPHHDGHFDEISLPYAKQKNEQEECSRICTLRHDQVPQYSTVFDKE